MHIYDITILITTKDRREELINALNSAIRQNGNNEILVIDDGSRDGTYEYVNEHYPSVRIIRYEENLGLIEQRNNGIRLAKSPYVITIDDDAIFTSDDTALEVYKYFKKHPNAGALALPYIDVLKDAQSIRQMAPTDDDYIVSAYVGTAHADRKDLFLKLGGYRGFLYRQGEEGDYCTRLLELGYYVYVADSSIIKHIESPRRVKSMNMYYEMRNNILYAWHNVPALYFIVHILGTFLVNLKKHIGLGFGFSSLRGALDGIFQIVGSQKNERKPVSVKTYKGYRYLRKNGVVKLITYVNHL